MYDNSLIEQGILKITKLIDGTPAGKENSGLKVGDFIISINGTKIEQGVNCYQQIRNTLGQETKLEVADSADGEKFENRISSNY